jgi:hypothetical protein
LADVLADFLADFFAAGFDGVWRAVVAGCSTAAEEPVACSRVEAGVDAAAEALALASACRGNIRVLPAIVVASRSEEDRRNTIERQRVSTD